MLKKVIISLDNEGDCSFQNSFAKVQIPETIIIAMNASTKIDKYPNKIFGILGASQIFEILWKDNAMQAPENAAIYI